MEREKYQDGQREACSCLRGLFEARKSRNEGGCCDPNERDSALLTRTDIVGESF
jgi:hypothetical protein